MAHRDTLPPMAIEKTHAMRVLDAAGVTYRATVYDASGAFHAAGDAAALLGAPAERVYKTLVALREGAAGAKPIMVMVRALDQLDLKALARATGDKKVRMATMHEAERLTGMRAGGISALALKRPAFDVLIDETARGAGHVHVSAGKRGVDIEVPVADLVRLTNARYAAVGRAPGAGDA